MEETVVVQGPHPSLPGVHSLHVVGHHVPGSAGRQRVGRVTAMTQLTGHVHGPHTAPGTDADPDEARIHLLPLAALWPGRRDAESVIDAFGIVHSPKVIKPDVQLCQRALDARPGVSGSVSSLVGALSVFDEAAAVQTPNPGRSYRDESQTAGDLLPASPWRVFCAARTDVGLVIGWVSGICRTIS